MAALIACPKCHRHVKQGEAACPFCASRTGARSVVGLAIVVAGLGGSAIGCYGPPPRDEDFVDAATPGADAGACDRGDASAGVCGEDAR